MTCLPAGASERPAKKMDATATVRFIVPPERGGILPEDERNENEGIHAKRSAAASYLSAVKTNNADESPDGGSLFGRYTDLAGGLGHKDVGTGNLGRHVWRERGGAGFDGGEVPIEPGGRSACADGAEGAREALGRTEESL